MAGVVLEFVHVNEITLVPEPHAGLPPRVMPFPTQLVGVDVGPHRAALWASSAKKADVNSGERDAEKRACASIVVVRPVTIERLIGTMTIPRRMTAISTSISVKPASRGRRVGGSWAALHDLERPELPGCRST